MLGGWCLRSRISEDGQRQVVNFLLPGETCGLFAIVFGRAEHEFSALTDAQLARVPVDRLSQLFASSPRMALLLTWLAARDERMLEEQIVRLGLKDSPHRLAHLLCELPLTQAVLADTLGLSRVHLNRVFGELAETGALDRNGDGRVRITDAEHLRRIAHFDDRYLRRGPAAAPREDIGRPDGD